MSRQRNGLRISAVICGELVNRERIPCDPEGDKGDFEKGM